MDCLVHQSAAEENFIDYWGKSDKYTGKFMWNLPNLKKLDAYQKKKKKPRKKASARWC